MSKAPPSRPPPLYSVPHALAGGACPGRQRHYHQGNPREERRKCQDTRWEDVSIRFLNRPRSVDSIGIDARMARLHLNFKSHHHRLRCPPAAPNPVTRRECRLSPILPPCSPLHILIRRRGADPLHTSPHALPPPPLPVPADPPYPEMGMQTLSNPPPLPSPPPPPACPSLQNLIPRRDFRPFPSRAGWSRSKRRMPW